MVASRELGLQGVSARPPAILPILPGSIATGSRSDTLPRQALVRLGSERWRSPGRCVATFVMPRRDPIPALKQQLVAAACSSLLPERAAHLGLRRGKLDRFSLETLIRYLARLEIAWHARAGRARASRAQSACRLGERGPVPGAQAGGNTARQYRQYCQRLRGGHRRALEPAQRCVLPAGHRPAIDPRRDASCPGPRCLLPGGGVISASGMSSIR